MAKQASPVELTELFFSRIDKLDPELNSFLLFKSLGEKAMKKRSRLLS